MKLADMVIHITRMVHRITSKKEKSYVAIYTEGKHNQLCEVRRII
jgi:hypothetical protein